jgi:hypothetical protein
MQPSSSMIAEGAADFIKGFLRNADLPTLPYPG